MQEEWVAMQDHIAELEAELMLKDAEIRQKDVCDIVPIHFSFVVRFTGTPVDLV
jgi:hypothetical protein